MAQRTKAAFKATKNSRYADNTTGLVTEVRQRDTWEDIVDSALFIQDNLIDDDTFATASASTVPSSGSVKAYVDAQVIGTGLVDTSARIFEDFFHSPQYFTLQNFNNGGGSGALPANSNFGWNATENALGVFSLSTGTSTAGGAGFNNVTYLLTLGNGFTLAQSWRVALNDLSDGTDTYIVRLGFMNAFSTTPTNGAYFRYTHSVNSGKWQAVTVIGGVETAEDTGITADTDTYHTFKIVANAGATQIDFYVDGVKTNDITTNIPNSTGGAEAIGYCCAIEKTAGSTARLLYADYFELTATRTTAR